MPTTKRVTAKRGKKIREAKQIHPDMDLKKTAEVLQTAVTARPEQAIVTPASSEPAPQRLALRNPNPGISSLTDEQRTAVTDLLNSKPRPSLSEIARRTGAKIAAVKHLADQTAIATGALATLRLNTYERRLGKRLPVKERVDVYAAVVRGQYEGTRAADRLRALERIEALEGIVTAREQRESESNQVHVGPLFVLPASASPVVDAVAVNVRPDQDKS